MANENSKTPTKAQGAKREEAEAEKNKSEEIREPFKSVPQETAKQKRPKRRNKNH